MELLGAYCGTDSEDDGEQPGISPPAHPSAPSAPPLTTAPAAAPHRVEALSLDSEHPLGAVPAGCIFKLRDRVYDDVFEREGVVVQFPLALDTLNQGKVLVAFDGSIDPIWRTWGHCTVKQAAAAAAATSTTERRKPTQLTPAERSQLPSAGLRGQARRTREAAGSDEAEPTAKKTTIINFFARAPPRDSGSSAGGAAGSSAVAALGAGVLTGAAAADVPSMSVIERERKPKLKPVSTGKRKARGPADEVMQHPTAFLEERISQYPDAPFVISNGFLRCSACQCIVSCRKKHLIEQHLKTTKHMRYTAKLERRKARDEGVIDDLRDFFLNNPNVVGASVSREEQAYRFNVTAALLAAGIPLNKADTLRDLLRRSGNALTDSSHLRGLVPLVEKQEVERTRADIAGQHLCIAFDGTRRVDEALNITGRFCSESFEINMKLLTFVTVAKHVDASALVRLINPILMLHLQIKPEMIVGFARDSVACNGLAMVTLSTIYGSSEDMQCMSHTLTHVGERFELELLDSFMTPWYTLVCNNSSAKSLWREMTGEPICGYSNTRWYSKAEIMMQIARHFDKLLRFLEQLVLRDIGDATTNKMLAIYKSSTPELRLSFAAMLDMRALVTTTYKLEGDRLEILLAFSLLEELCLLGSRLGEPGTLPNVDSVLRQGIELKVGVKISKLWPDVSDVPFEGTVVATSTALSTIHTGKVCKVYRVHYPSDKTTEELEDEEIRPLLMISELEVGAGYRDASAREEKRKAKLHVAICGHTRAHLTSIAADQFAAHAPPPLFASRDTRLAHAVAQEGDRLAHTWL